MGGWGQFTHRLIRCAVALAVGACFAFPAAAQTWNASHQFPQGDSRDGMVRLLAAELDKAGFTTRVFPAATLMRPRDQWAALVDGRLDLALLPVDYLSDQMPILGGLSLPGLIGSHARARRLSGSLAMKDIRARLEAAGAIVIADAWVAGAIGSTKHCLISPSDAKSMRVRASGRGFSDLWKAAGAEPINGLGSDALHSLLASNLVEALDTSTASMLHYRLYERLRCVTAPAEFSLWFLYEPVMVSKKSWDKLDEAKRHAVLEAGRRAEDWFFDQSPAIDGAMAQTFAEKGVVVKTLSAEQAAAWTALARRSAWRAFADKVPGGKDLLEKLQAVE